MTKVNAQQTEYWNVQSGPKWVANADTIDAQISPIGMHAIEHADVIHGERILDIGCGCGQTSLELGRRTGPEGEVLGVDLSGPMLADARRRASEAGLGHIQFEQSDAQVHDFAPGRFDLVFSRFGVMFFEDTTAAFANILKAVAPGGRLCFVAWQEITHNPWMFMPAMSAAKHLELPAGPAAGGPGPFAFAEADRVQGLLEQAGWAEVEYEGIETRLELGSGMSLEETVDFMLQLGPAGAALRDAPEDVRKAVDATAVEDLSAFYVDGALRMDSAAWMFTARAKG